MGIWAWVQPDKRIWKVVSDHEDGSIRVYDEDGTLILEKNDLSEEALTTVEDNFLDVSATNLDKNNNEHGDKPDGKPSERDDCPMYV